MGVAVKRVTQRKLNCFERLGQLMNRYGTASQEDNPLNREKRGWLIGSGGRFIPIGLPRRESSAAIRRYLQTSYGDSV